MNIRPVSDLRNHFSNVGHDVRTAGPVFLTKNGHDSMVLMSAEQFGALNSSVDAALGAADVQAATTSLRYTHDEVFGLIREALHGRNEP